MCQKCLWVTDGDDGIDFAPVYSGTGMRPMGKTTSDRFATAKAPHLNKIRFGDEYTTVTGWKRRPSYNRDERIEFEDGKEYTQKELQQLADQFLRDDAKTIDHCDCLCGSCETGAHCADEICAETSKPRGIGGKDPILFEEHIYQRQKREILNENGVPEPGLVQGIYYRAHPEGRKINSEEQRRKHGASYFR